MYKLFENFKTYLKEQSVPSTIKTTGFNDQPISVKLQYPGEELSKSLRNVHQYLYYALRYAERGDLFEELMDLKWHPNIVDEYVNKTADAIDDLLQQLRRIYRREVGGSMGGVMMPPNSPRMLKLRLRNKSNKYGRDVANAIVIANINIEKKYKNPGEVIDVKEIEKYFTVFHLSGERLEKDGDFKFTPRTPREPMYAEDDFTKRISLAPSVQKAQTALYIHCIGCHLYVGDIRQDPADDIPVVKLDVEITRCKKDLEKPKDNKYQSDLYDMGSFVKSHTGVYKDPGSPSALEPELRNKFYACVPDALETEEMWSLKSVSLYHMGSMVSADEVRLSKEGKKLLNFVKQKYQSK